MDLARANGIGRLVIGLGLVARPERLIASWIGGDARRAGAQVLARSLGIRDVALGAGLLAAGAGAGAGPGERRRWLVAATVADLTDLAVTLSAGDRLPLRGRVLVSLAAASGVAMGGAALTGRG